MERGSTQISPRKDEELKHEMQALLQSRTHESHVEEWKEQEPSGDDQPDVGGPASAWTQDDESSTEP